MGLLEFLNATMLEASEASALSSPLLPHLPTKQEALATGFPYAYSWHFGATGRSDKTGQSGGRLRCSHDATYGFKWDSVWHFSSEQKAPGGFQNPFLSSCLPTQIERMYNMSTCVYKSLYEQSNI